MTDRRTFIALLALAVCGSRVTHAQHAKYIVGVPYAEGRAMIEELNALAVHPDLTYKHRWRTVSKRDTRS